MIYKHCLRICTILSLTIICYTPRQTMYWGGILVPPFRNVRQSCGAKTNWRPSGLLLNIYNITFISVCQYTMVYVCGLTNTIYASVFSTWILYMRQSGAGLLYVVIFCDKILGVTYCFLDIFYISFCRVKSGCMLDFALYNYWIKLLLYISKLSNLIADN